MNEIHKEFKELPLSAQIFCILTFTTMAAFFYWTGTYVLTISLLIVSLAFLAMAFSSPVTGL